MSNVVKIRPLAVKQISLLGTLIFIATPLLAPLSTLAGEKHHQHGTHVHGIGSLNIAIEDKVVFIEMTSPAANIVGFEHKPANEEQEQAVHQAIEKLENVGKLYLFDSKAGCSLTEAKVSSSIHDGDHDKHEDHAEHGDHGKHAENSQDEAAQKPEESHSEFSATYHFNCDHPDKITSLEVLLFNEFPGFEKFEVQLLTPSGQTAATLTPDNNRIKL